jgi:hypothetical protein
MTAPFYRCGNACSRTAAERQEWTTAAESTLEVVTQADLNGVVGRWHCAIKSLALATTPAPQGLQPDVSAVRRGMFRRP